MSEYVDDNPATVAYQVVDYTYDDANQLLSRTVDHDIEGLATRFFVHQNGQIVLQFDGTDSTADLSHRYVWGPQVDQQLADEQLNLGYSESEVLWALSDHQGTVRDLAQYSDHANVEETIVWKHRRYDSFGILQAETNRGDFNGDGQLNLADVTILYDAVYDPQYSTYDVPDLNGDNVRDFADLEVMFEDILRTVVGDVYLDGTVSAAELNLVLNHWGQSVDWTLGDFDGDGFVGGGDLDVVLNGWGSNPNPLNTEVLDYAFGYTGRLFDEATGLQNNLNRWYDAKVGRWISEDPISFAGGDTNLYRYVGNSPTNYRDPNGLQLTGNAGVDGLFHDFVEMLTQICGGGSSPGPGRPYEGLGGGGAIGGFVEVASLGTKPFEAGASEGSQMGRPVGNVAGAGTLAVGAGAIGYGLYATSPGWIPALPGAAQVVCDYVTPPDPTNVVSNISAIMDALGVNEIAGQTVVDPVVDRIEDAF